MKATAYFMGAWPVWSETFIQRELAFLLKEGLPLRPMAVFPGNMPADAFEAEVKIIRPSASTSHSRTTVLGHAWLKGMLRRQLSMLKHSPTLNLVQKAMVDLEIEHIHAAFAGFPAMLASATARKLNISYSVSAHAADVFCCRYDDKFLFRKATGVFCCNQRVMDELADRSPWLEPKLTLIPHGVDLRDWPENLDDPPLSDPLRFLFIGRLVEKKDPIAAARLVRDLVRHGIQAELTVVGQGPLQESMAQEIDGYEAHFAGVIPHDSVPDMMANHDLLLNSSRELPSGDQEGVPNVILEAMAAGLPVLAPAVGSIPEVLSEDTGWIIDPDDTSAFIQTVESLVTAEAERHRRRHTARRLVESKYDSQKLAGVRATKLKEIAAD